MPPAASWTKMVCADATEALKRRDETFILPVTGDDLVLSGWELADCRTSVISRRSRPHYIYIIAMTAMIARPKRDVPSLSGRHHAADRASTVVVALDLIYPE